MRESGEVLLIVNKATSYGFPLKYEGLEALYKKYREQGLEFLAFTCDQFGYKVFGIKQKFSDFCQLTFQTFRKTDVKVKAFQITLFEAFVQKRRVARFKKAWTRNTGIHVSVKRNFTVARC
ncbi:hypothetical protein [Enterococcus sp. AZ126]|uniref:hypothetical protein n=1 Tax=Enterococcus sp. AZ126 TaxID=2774635 RepID=UPI003F6887C8